MNLFQQTKKFNSPYTPENSWKIEQKLKPSSGKAKLC